MEVYSFCRAPWFSAGYAAGFPYDRISAGKDISADLYQSAYGSQKMRISGTIFPLPVLTASEKNSLWLQTIPIPSSGSLMKEERLFWVPGRIFLREIPFLLQVLILPSGEHLLSGRLFLRVLWRWCAPQRNRSHYRQHDYQRLCCHSLYDEPPLPAKRQISFYPSVFCSCLSIYWCPCSCLCSVSMFTNRLPK